jgi:hypothetical protein
MRRYVARNLSAGSHDAQARRRLHKNERARARQNKSLSPSITRGVQGRFGDREAKVLCLELWLEPVG